MDRYIDLFQFCACRFHGNSMNNLLSYCGLIDAKIRAFDKNLPVKPNNLVFSVFVKKIILKLLERGQVLYVCG